MQTPFHAATRAQRPPSSAPSRLPGAPFPVSAPTWRAVHLVPMNPELGYSAPDTGPLWKHARPHSSSVTTPGAEPGRCSSRSQLSHSQTVRRRGTPGCGSESPGGPARTVTLQRGPATPGSERASAQGSASLTEQEDSSTRDKHNSSLIWRGIP